MPTRNVTLSLPDDLVRRAKVAAAERDTSMSALVATLLGDLLGGRRSIDEVWSAEEAVMAAGPLRVGRTRPTRDELHER